jgi:hypothetical protein
MVVVWAEAHMILGSKSWDHEFESHFRHRWVPMSFCVLLLCVGLESKSHCRIKWEDDNEWWIYMELERGASGQFEGITLTFG